MTRPTRADEYAFIAPFAGFVLLLSLKGWSFGHTAADAQYWLYPLQTILCGALLFYFRRRYPLEKPRRIGLTIFIAGIVFLIWIAPQEFFGQPRRLAGFNPDYFQPGSIQYWLSLIVRLVRLVVVVPLLEEIFWRGFLLRVLIKEDFTSVPIGAFSLLSFSIVAIFFACAHWGADFWPALLTGALFNLVALLTRNLMSCVLAHALTNALLGLYILRTGQWGFW